MSISAPVFRFAPSPNGPLHRGHALSALLNARLAQRHHGVFLLRIEDIDPVRSRPEHIIAIEDDLHWLGLDWQKPLRQQSDHMEDYARAFRALDDQGLIYRCFCSRRDISEAIAQHSDASHGPHDPDGAPLYPGTCRTLSAADIERRIAEGEIPQARLKMDEALKRVGEMSYQCFDPFMLVTQSMRCDASLWGDVVLVRKDTPTSYHLSVVVDDALQGVTHVVRGQDLEASTAIHSVLQRLLNLSSPAYWHHQLLLDADGQKLAKSRNSLSLRNEIAHGLTREALIHDICQDSMIAELLNFENEKPKGRRDD